MAEKDTVTLEEAIAMLPIGDYIHTFRNSSMMLLGADWTRASIIDALKAAPSIMLSGEMATSMNHGLVIEEGGSYLFIATKNG